MSGCRSRTVVAGLVFLGMTCLALADVSAAEADDETLILIEEDEPGQQASGDEAEMLIIESDEDAAPDAPVIVGGDDALPAADDSRAAGSGAGGPALRLDRARIEYAPLIDGGHDVDAIGLAQAELSLGWNPGERWEARIAARVDGFLQSGTPSADRVDLDYGETWLRYRGEGLSLTLGAQKVIWGRIDEIPPNDRLSTQDFTRFILDALPERRRARPMLRIEHFSELGKLDVMLMPTFRGAELPEKDSIWYPIDRRRGEIIGIPADPLLRQVVRAAAIDDDAPSDDDGIGLRFSRSQGALDMAVTVQHGRQSAPYYEYQPLRNTLRARYPHASSLGADLGIEAAGVLWRFEAAWVSDVPVTRRLGYRYDTVEAISWAAGVEFYPGDGDARINLQLAAMQLRDAGDVLDRDRIYNFNGSMEVPFAENRWRASMRFFSGLDKHDVYLNPRITFVGWEPHSLYAELHWFDGSNGTLGGFHQDHALIALGWRAEF